MHTLNRRELITGLAGTGLAARSAGAAVLLGASSVPLQRDLGDILRPPDLVRAFAGLNHSLPLQESAGTWSAGGIEVRFEPRADCMPVFLAAPGVQPTHVHVRWNATMHEDLLILGDAWERSYGDLHWGYMVPERAMPWYFLVHDGHSLVGYGVKTGAGALCFWQVDPQGISLWLNVSNGGSGVVLRDRKLLAATLVVHRGAPGRTSSPSCKCLLQEAMR